MLKNRQKELMFSLKIGERARPGNPFSPQHEFKISDWCQI